MEVSVTHDVFLQLQGRMHSGQPSAACSAAAGGLVSETPPLPTPTAHPVPLSAGRGGLRKVCRTEEAAPCPFSELAAGVLHMRVKEGSKIRNLMSFAMGRMQGEGGGGAVRQIVFAGSGRAVTKTITCVEIMKRKVQGLHQVTKLHYKGVQEVWESPEGGASEMTVHRTVPSISILLSKDPLDPQEPGYQPPAALWEMPSQEEKEAEGQPLSASKRPSCSSAQPSQADTKRLCLMDGSCQC